MCTYCDGAYPETWNIESLLERCSQTIIRSVTLSEEQITNCAIGSKELQALMTVDALESYAAQGKRTWARNGFERLNAVSCLDVIDQHWREHLYEMDYSARRYQPSSDGSTRPSDRMAT
jgi:preprotein translocase subunit SecA